MDADLRELDRRWRSGDTEALGLLEHARRRAGLGWFGEELVEGRPAPKATPRVYDYNGVHPLSLELVYVPGGMTECDHLGRKPADCPGDLHPIAPFFAGRFPVLWEEWLTFRRFHEGSAYPGPNHPITGITFSEVLEFCRWSGLRLMTAEEWRWCAFGGVDNRICGHCDGEGKTWEPEGEDQKESYGSCPACWRGGVVWNVSRRGARPRRTPRYPWGDTSVRRWDNTRCAWGAPEVQPSRSLETGPLRPSGRSWCDVYDLTGNVSQWVSSDQPPGFAIMGGSFRSNDPMHPHHEIAFGGANAMDHVGFRVALSIQQQEGKAS